MTLDKVINVLNKNTKKSLMGNPLMAQSPDFAITEEIQAKRSQKAIVG